jgi:hypothetical protein
MREQNLPKWFKEVFDSEQLLSRAEQQRFWEDLYMLYSMKRVDPKANVLFHLSVATIKHHHTLLFLEEAVQHQAGEIISLRTRIKTLEETKRKRPAVKKPRPVKKP